MAAQERPRGGDHVGDETPHDEQGDTEEPSYPRHIDAELGPSVYEMNAGLRDALPVPPAAEVVVGEPTRGYVVLQNHLGDVQTARARRARAIEELRLLLTEERTSHATE